LKPETSGKLTLNLKPGPYLLMCNQPGHWHAGMWTKFTVTSSATEASNLSGPLRQCIATQDRKPRTGSGAVGPRTSDRVNEPSWGVGGALSSRIAPTVRSLVEPILMSKSDCATV
jgi:Sulfocyanin (SoxE) domain